jgi:hypothetical protein
VKLILICTECIISSNAAANKGYPVQVNEDGIYQSTCESGHEIVMTLQAAPFELLFEAGMIALTEDFTREAVSDFVSARERFYQTYIRVVSIAKKIPEDLSASLWSKHLNRSERQFGAFAWLYLLENKSVYKDWDNIKIKFRNDVIHDGYFPTIEEARKFGKSTYEALWALVKNLWDLYPDALNEYKRLLNSEKQVKVVKQNMLKDGKIRLCGASLNTAINLTTLPWKDSGVKPFEDVFQKLKNDLSQGTGFIQIIPVN